MVEFAKATDAHFEVAFSPCLRLVSVVRQFVGEFYAEILSDPDAASQLAVATHELLENSARYAKDSTTSVRIDVKRTPEAVVIGITTRNRANEADIATLKEALDEIIAAPDAQAHYQTLMRRTAKRAEGSGLGLGRVRAESEMQMRYTVEGDTVVLRAEARIPAAETTPP